MSRKISWDKAGLAAAAGIFFFLAFPPFNLFPCIFVFAALFTLLTLRCSTFREGFGYGFITSLAINIGGFYWVTYVIHVFGSIPWVIAGLIYLLFCGFGALSFPTFAGIASWLNTKVVPERMPPLLLAAWFTLALPAWFLIPEYFVPKLFPFYAGHCFYWLPITTQISEITGALFLSFALFSGGGALALAWQTRRWQRPFPPMAAVIPVLLWAIILVFGAIRLNGPEPDGRDLNVALIQANIGSLEKVQARKGVRSKLQLVYERYFSLTEQALHRTPHPDLILWPETAMPIPLDGPSLYAETVRLKVNDWQIPLITGGYASHETDYARDYNAAFLLVPKPGTLHPESTIYRKNILLAFGEYFPGGETFPFLYRWFPQVSNFARGKTQEPFVLPDGTRLGVTICYEAIVPSFYRRVARLGVQAVVNLTNDSWFGPTSEPKLHGALSVFRAVEMRAPLLRVTNTGISFVVDSKGRMSDTTGVYEEGVLNTSVKLPSQPINTFYLRYGDWLVVVAAALALGLSALALRRSNVPVPA